MDTTLQESEAPEMVNEQPLFELRYRMTAQDYSLLCRNVEKTFHPPKKEQTASLNKKRQDHTGLIGLLVIWLLLMLLVVINNPTDTGGISKAILGAAVVLWLWFYFLLMKKRKHKVSAKKEAYIVENKSEADRPYRMAIYADRMEILCPTFHYIFNAEECRRVIVFSEGVYLHCGTSLCFYIPARFFDSEVYDSFCQAIDEGDIPRYFAEVEQMTLNESREIVTDEIEDISDPAAEKLPPRFSFAFTTERKYVTRPKKRWAVKILWSVLWRSALAALMLWLRPDAWYLRCICETLGVILLLHSLLYIIAMVRMLRRMEKFTPCKMKIGFYNKYYSVESKYGTIHYDYSVIADVKKHGNAVYLYHKDSHFTYIPRSASQSKEEFVGIERFLKEKMNEHSNKNSKL